MFFNEQQDSLETIIAKSADLTNKPFIHSVVKLSGEMDLTSDDIDLTVKILCRDCDGNRFDRYDLELEIFKSKDEIVLVISKLNYPDEPILWVGSKTLWMDSTSGKKCIPPKYSSSLENLANRIKTLIN